jgi:hypothetical protein
MAVYGRGMQHGERIRRAGASMAGATEEVLAGTIDRMTFHNSENGFCVLRVKARGRRDLITVVGHAASISAGEWVTAIGEWVNDRTHGPQFRARFLRASAPTTAEGIEKYLASGMIRDIGPGYAKRLVRAFSGGVSRLRRARGRVGAAGADRPTGGDRRGVLFLTGEGSSYMLGTKIVGGGGRAELWPPGTSDPASTLPRPAATTRFLRLYDVFQASRLPS